MGGHFLQTMLSFVFALGILIIFHELGHFWVARLCGVRVLRFSVGIGKPLWIKKFGNSETEWTLSAIPLGGYVKFYDSREIDNATPSAADLAGDFSKKSVWRRIAIVAAGPVFNFVLAIILFSALFMHGTPDPIAKIRVASDSSIAYQAGLRHGDTIQTINGETVQSWSDMHWKLLQAGMDKQDVRVQVARKNTDRSTSEDHLEFKLPLTRLNQADFEANFLQKMGMEFFRPAAILKEVVQGGPASKAGLKAGDQIVQIDQQPVLDSQAFRDIVNASPNKPLTMLVHGSGQEFEVLVTPEAVSENGKTIGRVQVAPQSDLQMTSLSYSAPESLYRGVIRTWDTSVLTVKMIGKILIGEVSWRNITGPITIADFAGQTARAGWLTYLQFIALISISLGVMNLLPIPVLDGGHLLYYSLEVLIGKPIPEKYVEMAQRGGLTVLLCLMLVAFFNDIVRQMS
ncbi:RIP metalloprotease RseP [Undibacterium flavidum]|uniref:Zinc metalloprotease n=1 Tax=Undibacterium flavidum TaxID=2762297 RepID=A0ABR6YCN5_9BURK|nr:RIP metalloprotease RseP [Undibacterium flavidum]MBC3874327.1 RIP metalloprotease RseP [Undibacterium flavidum]